MRCLKIGVLSLLVTSSIARDIPDNLRDFYNHLRGSNGCGNKLASGFYAKADGSNSFSYCGDFLKSYGVIYLQGPGGQLADMDVDCDGLQGGVGDDGRCGSSTDTQNQTTFRDTLVSYGQSVTELNANVHPYAVFGNQGSRKGYANFDPTKYGVQPLSVMAVVCNNKLIYGVWGDTNGDDGALSMVGEAAISLATACYGQANIAGNNGHDSTDVLYLAFTGKDAVPGKAANWGATNFDDFESSIATIGDSLVAKVGSSGVSIRASVFLLLLQGAVVLFVSL